MEWITKGTAWAAGKIHNWFGKKPESTSPAEVSSPASSSSASTAAPQEFHSKLGSVGDWFVPDFLEKKWFGSAKEESKGLSGILPEAIRKPVKSVVHAVTHPVETVTDVFKGGMELVKKPFKKMGEWAGDLMGGGNWLTTGLKLACVAGAAFLAFSVAAPFLGTLLALALAAVVVYAATKVVGGIGGLFAGSGNSAEQATTSGLAQNLDKAAPAQAVAQAKATPAEVKAAMANLNVPDDLSLVKNSSGKPPSVPAAGKDLTVGG